MADDINPHIGSSLDDLLRAAERLERTAGDIYREGERSAQQRTRVTQDDVATQRRAQSEAAAADRRRFEEAERRARAAERRATLQPGDVVAPPGRKRAVVDQVNPSGHLYYRTLRDDKPFGPTRSSSVEKMLPHRVPGERFDVDTQGAVGSLIREQAEAVERGTRAERANAVAAEQKAAANQRAARRISGAQARVLDEVALLTQGGGPYPRTTGRSVDALVKHGLLERYATGQVNITQEGQRSLQRAIDEGTLAAHRAAKGEEDNARAVAQKAAANERAAREAVAAEAAARPRRGELPAAGQTAQMPVSPLVLGRQARQFTVGGAYDEPQGGPRPGGTPRRTATAEIAAAAQAHQDAARAADAHASAEARAAENQARAGTAAAQAAAQQQQYVQAMVASERRQLASERAAVGHAGAIQQQTAAIRAATPIYRQHGALTTEFIEAAARGETNYREWGYQIGATAGKFAGWTAVSIPVFAALDGIRRIGQGAIDSSSGVNQLQRVIDDIDAGEAQQAFRDLSRDFNVPLETVADAVYRMGQRFHTLPEATEAARAALLSFKTGEVDVATSTQNLLAMVDGFGLSATDLTSTFDQINEAQNRFGITIGNTEAGLAKAAGTYRNAGGDLNTLLALFVAISRATGRSGQEIGTGIARGVTQIRQVSNQETLASLGVKVDPNDFQQAILDAMRAAREGADPNVLASALLGNQYARLIAPVLKNQSTFNAALADTAPAKAQGSAMRELAIVLTEPREQIAALGNELERFGSVLMESGAFAPLLGAVRGMSEGLGVINSLIENFNRLPDAIQASVAAIGGLGLAVTALRRTGVAEGRGGVIGDILGRPEPQRAKIALRQSLREYRDYLQQESIGFGGRARRADLEAMIAERHVGETERAFRGGIASAGDVEQAHERRNVAKTQVAEIKRRRDVLDEMIQDERALSQEFKRTNDYLGFGERSGLFVTSDTNRPTEARPGQIAGGRMPQTGMAADLAALAGAPEYREAADANRRIATEIGRTERGVPIYRRSLGELTRSVAVSVHSGNALAAAAGRGRAVLARAPDAMSRASAAVGRLPGQIFRTIGPLGAFFIGVEGAVLAGNALKDKFRERGEFFDRMGAIPTTESARTSQADEARRKIAEREARSRKIRSNDSDVQRREREAFLRGDEEYQRAQETLRNFEREEALDRRRKGMGLPRPSLTKGKVDEDFKRIEREFRDGNITVQQRREALQRLLADIQGGGLLGPNERRGLSQRVQSALRQGRGAGGVAGLFSGAGPDAIDLSAIEKDVDALGKLAESPRVSAKELERLFAENTAALTKRGADPSVTGRAEYAERLAITGQIKEGLQAQLERDLSAASSQRERNEAYADYFAAIGSVDDETARMVEGIKDPRQRGRARRALRDQREILRDREMRERAFEEQEAYREADVQVRAADRPAGVGRARFLLSAITARIQRAIRTYGRDSVEVLRLMGQQQDAEAAVVQERLSLVQAETGLREARAGNDTRAAGRARAEGLRRELALMRENPDQFSQADLISKQAEIVNAMNQANQEAKQKTDDLLRARYDFLASQTTDPVQQARLQFQLANRVVQRGGFEGPADRYRALAERNRARTGYQEARFRQRVEDIDFYRDVGRYTTEQEIAALHRLERTMKLTKDQKREIQRRVHQLRTEADREGELDLNLDSVRLPTLYEIRRAVGNRQQGQSIVNQNRATVIVNSQDDVPAVARVMEQHNQGLGRAMARQAGRR